MHTRACSDKSSTATGLHGEARLPARPNLCRARAGVRTPGPSSPRVPRRPRHRLPHVTQRGPRRSALLPGATGA